MKNWIILTWPLPFIIKNSFIDSGLKECLRGRDGRKDLILGLVKHCNL